MFVRAVGLRFARALGSQIFDASTQRPIGKALLIPWRGRIHVIGLEKAVIPRFLPQKRLTYWKQELGFTVHPPPDFPREVQGSTPDLPSPTGASRRPVS